MKIVEDHMENTSRYWIRRGDPRKRYREHGIMELGDRRY